jgi:hypothetical protein
MNSTPEQEEQPQQQIRVIQVDRKIANQLGDVWTDLKVILLKQMKEAAQKKSVQPPQT